MDMKLIEAANAAGHTMLDQGPVMSEGKRLPGIVCAANEASFAETFMSVPLNTFIAGMPLESDIQDVLDFIAPPVPTGRRFEYRGFGNVQQMLSEVDDVRGLGANFKTVEFKGDLTSSRTVNKGLAFIGDLDQVGEIPNWEQLYAGWLRNRVLRNELRRAVTAILAIHAGTAYSWRSGTATDPDTDLLTLVEAVGDTYGMDANAVLFGNTAWSYRVQNLRSTDKAGGFASSMWTPAQLGEWLGLSEGARKSNHRYATGTGDKTRMVGAYVVAFHRSGSPVMEDPSTLKRFVTTTGGAFQVYRRELSAKLVEISVAHYSNVVAVGGARKGNIT
jgi:hypothetical protein